MRRALISVAVAAMVAGSAGAQVRQQLGVMTPMRDGVRLASDVWLPKEPGRYPVILIRTPYLKSMDILDVPKFAAYYASKGYAFVIQDVRGRGDSEGEFNFFQQEAPDGYDTIEWLAKQPFSKGRVGMMGVSYLGTVQWLAAREQPPSLVCIAPTAAAGRYLEELPYQGGALMHQWALGWVNGVSGNVDQGPNLRGTDWKAVFDHRPLLTSDSAMGRSMRLYREWLANPLMNDYWKPVQFAPADFAKIRIPTLTVTGWFDGDQPGALFYWRQLMQHAPDKNQHFLVAGPWNHIQTFLGGSTKMGELEFTPESVIDNKALHLDFFDWCLKQTKPRFDAPRSKIYLTGVNEWRTGDSYPPPEATAKTMYFSSGGRANSMFGDGRLGWNAPGPTDPPDRFRYDPKSPVPSELTSGGDDRSPLQRRDDVLIYTSDVLTEPVDVVGTVIVNVEAATDGRDTDFTAILTDVGPDGKALVLGPNIGIRRGRYRHGPEREELLTPGKPETFRIELYDIAHQFKPGHRIRVEVSSSAAPHFNPNQNTGNPIATDTTWRVAQQTVYHDRARPSRLVLPVVARRMTP
jgi:putative CocE/NonD family hydrolase